MIRMRIGKYPRCKTSLRTHTLERSRIIKGAQMLQQHDPGTDHNTLPERVSLSIPEFCRRNSISKSLFYKLRRQGLGPRVMTVGERQLISVVAELDWQREREAVVYKPRRRDKAIAASVTKRTGRQAIG
jgi:hypothetical protein